MIHELEFEKLKENVQDCIDFVELFNSIVKDSSLQTQELAVWKGHALDSVTLFCKMFPEDSEEIQNWWNNEIKISFSC